MNKAVLQAAGFGIVAGMRAASAPALLTRHYCKHPSRALKKSGFGWVCSDKAAIALGLMAAGEVVGDKLPFAGDRIAPGGLIGRGISGALAGAILNKASGGKAPAAWLIGAAAAIVSSFASFYGRKALSKKVPDLVVAVAEDAIVYGVGSRLLD